jgi:hypothetical protein
LYGDQVSVDGIVGARVDDGVQILKALRQSDKIQVTWLALTDLLSVRAIDILVDARMQKYRVTPDLRRLAGTTIGLGPGFSTDVNCDLAIETRPGRSGLVVPEGWTDAADGIASPLGDAGAERFHYSRSSGRWHSAIEIGSRVFKGFVLGHLAGEAVRAPCDGIVRGIVRDGSDVPAKVKLLEIDARGRHAQWTGIDGRGRSIADAVGRAVTAHAASRSDQRVGPFQAV